MTYDMRITVFRKIKHCFWIIAISLSVLLVLKFVPHELPQNERISHEVTTRISWYHHKDQSRPLQPQKYRTKFRYRKRPIKSQIHNVSLSVDICSDPNDRFSWTFRCYVNCPTWNIDNIALTKRKFLHIQCIDNIGFSNSVSSSITNISVIPFRHPCIRDVIKQKCTNDKAVPKIVHYVWLGNKPRKFEFYHFLSVFSAYKFIQPCIILFHGETLPFGSHWDYLLTLVPNIVHVYRVAPVDIYGIKLGNIEHKADITRLEAVLEYGGIYIDTDTIILKSLDTLRDYNFTLSKAFDFNLSNGLIMSTQNATFANIWYKEYRSYDPKQWGTHSTILPFKLSKIYPNLIHVEEKTFVKPNGGELDLLFGKNFDWSNNFAIHLFIRYYRKYKYDIDVIKKLNTTMGSVARYVLFDNKDLCLK